MIKKDSNALLEVLKWKDEAYKEIEHLDLKKALKKRIRKSIETTEKLGFKRVEPVHK